MGVDMDSGLLLLMFCAGDDSRDTVLPLRNDIPESEHCKDKIIRV